MQQKRQKHYMRVFPEFCDFLRLVDGKVPLVVELKAEGRNEKALTDAAMRALADYTGLFCVESFSPAVVDYLKKAYPAVVRGQLAGALNKEKKTITRFPDMLLKMCIRDRGRNCPN